MRLMGGMTSIRTRKTLSVIAPLFLVLFIDGMGLSLLFPVLNSIIIDPHSDFLAASVSITTRDFLYGLTIGIFMICWFFGAAILGDLSDAVGRKKALMICLIGSFLGYLVSAFAVLECSLTFLILGRVIAGFTAGSQPIAQAAIVDISPPEHKARNIGFILLAISLGFTLGPIIGGFLSNSQFVRWFNFSTPLYFASLIALFNAGLLWLLFKEAFHQTREVKIRLHHAINIFLSAFRHKRVRMLSLVFLVMIYGWSNFFTFVSLFALRHYQFTPIKVSLMVADIGVGFSIASSYFIDIFVNRYYMKNIIVISFLLAALGILVIVAIHSSIFLWIMLAFIGAAIAVGYSTILALFSNQVGENEQGWVMGVTGSIMALCFGISAFFSGYLANFEASIPLYLAVASIATAGLIMWLIPRKKVES